MSKTIVIFGFHAIQAQLDSAPEGFVKVLILIIVTIRELHKSPRSSIN